MRAKKGNWITGLVFSLVLVMISSLALGQSASVVDGSGNPINLYFTGTSTNPGTWYQDAMDGNPDVGLELCDLGQKYVGGTYAINVNGQWKYVLITYNSDTNALALTDRDMGGGCYAVTPGYLTFSPSYLSTPNPDVYFAAFPGYVWVTYADNANPGVLSNFIRTNQVLRGTYDVHRTFTQSTGKVTVEEPLIRFQSQSQLISAPASDTEFGVNDQRRMVVGICTDSYGASCSDGYVVSSASAFPMDLDPGASPIDDQHIYHRYVVINGVGGPICIGANLKVTINSVQPNPVYYDQYLNITYTVTNPRDTPYEINGGNVDVSHTFNVEVKIYQQGNTSNVVFDQTYSFTGLPVDGSITRTVTWDAKAHSGTYVVEVTVDPNNAIAECNEGDNTAQQTFELKPVILPTIKINGNESIIFPHPGVPYNVSIHLENSDGDIVNNATVNLTQINGVSPFVPTQIWNATLEPGQNETQVGTRIFTRATFKSDENGNVTLTVIPTGNPIYSPSYAYFHPTETLGDYQIYMDGIAKNGEEFVFVRNHQIFRQYNLTLDTTYNYTYDYPAYLELPNRDSVVDLALNVIYTIFTKFWKAVTLGA